MIETQQPPSPSRFTLYSEPGSPYSAPVRVAIYAKGLQIEIIPPPDGLKSASYHRINPIGTIPCLVRDDGFVLPESAAILDYLDDLYPEPMLRPTDPDQRAHMRLLQRIGELGVMTSIVELLALAKRPDRDDQASGPRLTRLVRALASLDVFLENHRFAIDGVLTLADCQLGPALAKVPAVVRAYRTGDLIGAYPVLSRYFVRCREHPAVARVLHEMSAATAGGARGVPAH
jgi:glutathione S-transferase